MTTVPNVPYSFTPGSVIASGQVNANFSSLVTNANLILQGTTTNDSAAPGFIGEYISSDLTKASGVSLAGGAEHDITSVSLTAGDWDCRGAVAVFNPNKSISYLAAWISAVSATMPTALENGGMMNYMQLDNVTVTPNKDFVLPISSGRISLASTTTIYLSVKWNGGGGGTNPTGYGFIGCRRVR